MFTYINLKSLNETLETVDLRMEELAKRISALEMQISKLHKWGEVKNEEPLAPVT